MNDKVYIDSRFVDGGFFQQKNNNLFFTGLFYIHSLEHSISGNEWTTNYSLLYSGELKTETYSASSAAPPKPQSAALMEEVKSNSSGTVNKGAAPKDSDKKKPDSKTSKSSTSKPEKPKKEPTAVTSKTVMPVDILKDN